MRTKWEARKRHDGRWELRLRQEVPGAPVFVYHTILDPMYVKDAQYIWHIKRTMQYRVRDAITQKIGGFDYAGESRTR